MRTNLRVPPLRFDREELKWLTARARSKGETLHQYLSAALTEGLEDDAIRGAEDQ